MIVTFMILCFWTNIHFLLMSDNRIHIYLFLFLVLAQSSPNYCKFLSDKSTRSISFSKWLWRGSGMEAGHQKAQTMISSLEFSASSPHPPYSTAGRRAVNGVNDWLCLHEVSIKSQRYGVWRASRLVNTSAQGRWHTIPSGPKLQSVEPPRTHYVSLHLAVHLCPSSYPFISWQT